MASHVLYTKKHTQTNASYPAMDMRCRSRSRGRALYREHTVNEDLMEGKTTSLFLNNDSLEEVTQFKYLGVTITDDLSWSKQVSSVVSKARRILGMIYRKFYRFCGTSTLLRLYKAYVKPHLDYCSFVWDPPLFKDQEALESVQKFALRLCCKKWSAAYLQLLDSTGLTTLSAERKIAKLCFLYKIVNNLTSFPAITSSGSDLLFHSTLGAVMLYFYLFPM